MFHCLKETFRLTAALCVMDLMFDVPFPVSQVGECCKRKTGEMRPIVADKQTWNAVTGKLATKFVNDVIDGLG